MLLNGKDIDRFMDRHLPIIHEIMFQPVRDGLFRNISQYNEILNTQLWNVLDQRQS